MLHIYVDGSARRNGKKDAEGGYGIIIFDDNNNLIDAFRNIDKNITNNQM